MGKTKIEEGKAYSYRNHFNDDDSTIDPDISLSYIDEKLQDVLGHFQKDFEGGVSAENLGTKFGGYGSFLPTYQHSPVWQRPQTPQKSHSSNTSRSQNNLQLEGFQTNSLVPPRASVLLNRGSTFAAVASTNSLKDSANEFSKRNGRMNSVQSVEVSTSGCEPDKNFLVASDRSLKVRIKVGSDNLSAEKNADIYTGLGLDISPSVSADGSPVGSERFHEPFNTPEESPTSILQIMTSLPVDGGLLLSPLSHDLIYLSEKQKFHGEIKLRSGQQVSHAKHADRVKGGHKNKFSRKKEFPVELKNHVNKDSQNLNGLLLKKERHVGHLADGGLVEDSEISNKLKRECSSDTVKREAMEVGSTCDIGLVDLPSGISGMVFKEEKVDSANDLSVYPRESDYLKREITGASSAAISDVCYRKKFQCSELVDQSELNNTFLEEDYLASKSKRKSKVSQSQVLHCTEVTKESSNADASLASSGRKREHVILPKSEVEDSKPQEDLGKVSDAYRDFFGDMEMEQDDDGVDLEDMISKDRLEQFKEVEKSASKVELKENSCGKKRDKPSIPEENPKAAPTEASTMEFGPISEAVAETGAVIPVVKEDWVCCDKCQKWRLLPLGRNPDDLPDKWICSMLDWLPGMNQCSFSEEETTKALVVTHQLPAPSGALHGSSLIDASVFDGKKCNGVKGVSASENRDGSCSNSVKINLQASVRGHCSNHVNQSSLVTEIETQDLGKSSALEKQRHKQKWNRKPHEQHLGRSEISRKRDHEPGRSNVSKKAKLEDDWMSDHDRPLGKVGPTSSSGLPLIAGEKSWHKNEDHHSRDRKRDTNKGLKDPSRNSLHQSTERKRKISESPLYHRSDLLEATSENDDRMEKKVRVSKSVVGEDTCGGKGSGGSRNHLSTKEQQFGPDLGMESLKRDLGSVQPSQATSSSSKVSGSHHKATISKEVKGSPVESVSSSPLRFLNQDKPVTMRSLNGKVDFGNAALYTNGSPRKGLDQDEGESAGSRGVRKDEFFVNRRGSVGSSGLEFHGKDAGHPTGSEFKLLQSSEVNRCFADDATDIIHTGNQHLSKTQRSNQWVMEEPRNEKQSQAIASRPKKFGKGSLISKNKNGNSLTQHDQGKLQVSSSYDDSGDRTHYDKKKRALKNSVQEQIMIGSPIVEQAPNVGKDESKVVENGKRNGLFIHGENNRFNDKVKDSSLDQKEILRPERDEISSKRLPSHELSLSGRSRSGTETGSLHLVSRAQKKIEAKTSVTDGTVGDNMLKALKPSQRPEKQNGNQPSKSAHAHLTPIGHNIKDVDTPSPARRDSSSQAGNSAVKEAKDLKHLADRLKNSGSNAESTSLYFQAALKFLHGASLLESCNSESTKKGEMIVSMQVYSSTAKLCEFCAREYEKCKDFAAAALAYKLMEVAYMRVTYSSNTNVCNDCHELQTALQIVPLGESPSSSVSDIDNVNNPATIDKAPLVNSVGSPQVIGNHSIDARNRPSLARMLNFVQDVNFAMEASRKSRNAFATASSRSNESQVREGITSIKKALDFNFHDVERLLRLVRLAMDAISH